MRKMIQPTTSPSLEEPLELFAVVPWAVGAPVPPGRLRRAS
ncbi:hypothetical protein [Actinomyces radicidentis]|nr:hypothetical protein [Actinomyces radicidentis]